MMRTRTCKLVLHSLVIIGCMIMAWGCATDSSNNPQPPYKIQIVNDIQYIAGDDQPYHRLDIYYPTDIAHPTVIFFVHGGAWMQGDKSEYPELAKAFSMYYGYTVVVTNYRLSNDMDGNAVHPDHINDVAVAFAWVQKNITGYGGDPGRVFLFGQSAGAHLVSLLATDPTYLQAQGYDLDDLAGVISMSASYDLVDLAQSPPNPLGLNADEVQMFQTLFKKAFGSWDDTVLGPASPQNHIGSPPPPVLVVYADQDVAGFAPEAVNFQAAVLNLKGPAISLAHLIRSDFSDETWAAATAAAAAEPKFKDYVGHYAEFMAITTTEHESRSTQLVVNFIKENS